MTTPCPTQTVQRQLDAYNARDIDTFLAQFAADAAIFELGSATPSTQGTEALRARYGELFERSPRLHCTVLNRSRLGRAVVDLEHIVGRLGQSEALMMLAIYEVEHGLIQRAHFVRA